jgi:polysulfide reductase chain C
MNETTWGILIVVYLFLAGLGAGSFCLGAITSRKTGPGWEACSRMGFQLAPFAIAIGLLLLILDLGHKTRFWLTLTVLNVESPMSVGVWLLSAFLIVSVLSALSSLPDLQKRRIPIIGNMSLWNRPRWKNTMARIGMPLALGVSVYTGVLLSATVIPLWRSLSLPLLIFLSALSLGVEGGAILGAASLGRQDAQAMEEPRRFLNKVYRVILPLYLFAALFFMSLLAIIPDSRAEFFNLMSGWSGLVWWLGVIGIGIFAPWIFVIRRNTERIRHAWVFPGCLLVGDFLLRLVIILAGQGAL